MNRSSMFFLLSALTLTPLAPPVAGALGFASADGVEATSRAERPDPGDFGLPSFRQAVQAIGPSVVNISTTREIAPTPMAFPFGGLFGGSPFAPMPAPRQRMTQRSLGSGVIVSADGHVLTNHHVVDGADEILVTLADGRSFEAELVGSDAPTDLAVLSIDAHDVPPAELAATDDVEVGDWVLAVGNPFGLGHTVTSGIVGAKQRTGVGITEFEDFLQTDAAINPGNSGGPLVDLAGRIVGINTAIASRTGGNHGIGFAIPGEMARRVLDDLLDDGQVERGQLGVYIQDLTPDMAASFDHHGHGVLVTQVVQGSPAEEAGLRTGDIITSVDGRDMTSARELATTVATLPTGRPVEVLFSRDGDPDAVHVTLHGGAPRARPRSDALARLGLELGELSDDVIRRHGLDGHDGALVQAVTPGSLAQRAGLAHGDRILSVDGETVEGPAHCETLLADADLGSGLRLLVESKGQRRFLLLRDTTR